MKKIFSVVRKSGSLAVLGFGTMKEVSRVVCCACALLFGQCVSL